MENTTGVIFGEFVQMHKRELMDNHLINEKVVAHEMFHHWFGDLLTTENWANLTLNEGFANYSEYLWMEHKYGKAAADEHHMNDQGGYLYSAQDGGHPLIHFGYGNREDMFDAHSYNKGGQVLHMLRNYLGDEAFFAGVQRYLENNAYSDVEAHELRLAFEDVTGQDLNWFFNQWFFAAGHPQLNVNTGYDASKGQAFIAIDQIQEGEEVPAIFNLPLTARIYYADGSFEDHKIRMTKRNQRFTFNVQSKPAFISYDASRSLLAQVKDQHTTEEYRFILQHGSQFRDRFDAVSYLSESEEDETESMMRALQDESRLIRMVAMSTLDPTDAQAQTVLKKLAANDPEPDVKAQAFAMLGESENKDLIPLITTGLKDDQAYSVVGAALSALMQLDEAAALDASKALENATSPALISALSRMYSNNPRPEFQSWFVKQTENADFMNAFTLFEAHQKYLVGLGNDQFIAESLDKWEAISMSFDKSSAYRRFASTKAMSETRKYYREVGDMVKANEVDKRIKAIIASEPDPTLQLYYGMFE
jgi:aminopeptidase N